MTIHNLVVISDLHIGCQLGLCHPDGHPLDEGGRYLPNKLQRTVWEWWEEFWNEVVPDFCRGEPYGIVLNGDALDGRHHNATHQWTHNLTDQAKAAEMILRPIVERAQGGYYHIRGTEAHGGPSGAQEEALAAALGAIPNDAGQHARYELWIRVGRGLAHIAHHIGTSGSMHYESTAPMRELTEAYVEAGRWNNEPPDWVVRSHRHRNCEVRVQTHKGFATVCITPAWQLKTPFAYRIAGARQALPQIGGTVLRSGDEDLYTRHKVWNLSRDREETLCLKSVAQNGAKSLRAQSRRRARPTR